MQLNIKVKCKTDIEFDVFDIDMGILFNLISKCCIQNNV